MGANIGYFTVLSAALVGKEGRVYAFEPEPANFALLQHNLELNGVQQRVTACEAALSDRRGRSRLYLSDDNLGDHQATPGATGTSLYRGGPGGGSGLV